MQIESGVGNGYKASVDTTNRIATRSIVEGGEIEAAVNGDQYYVTSGSVTLTNAAESAVIWYQNEEEFSLLLDEIIFGAAVSTGGTTNVCALSVTINPTGLTSGSSTEVIDLNANIGSSKTLITTSSEIGAQGASVSGGTQGPIYYYPDKLTSVFEANAIIPRGTGIAISVTPPASNTSLAVNVSFRVHKLIGV